MVYRLIALLAIASPALTLSSHSPVDLESYPAFAVSFNEHHPILNETALELLKEPLETPPHSLQPKRHLLRTPSGQGFLCTVPAVTIAAKKRAQQQAELDESTRQSERQRGLERGLALLEPMRSGCIYLKQNWFTYSFCYGSEIRQFHAVQVAGSPIPKEDPNSEAYVLGLSPEPSIYTSNPKYGSGSLQVAKKEALIPSTLGGSEGVGLDESGRYLVQVWEGGSTCDKTGLPRTVEVQYHCNTQTIDRIALIRETSICRYVLLIHTPRLCAEPLFLEGADKNSEPASVIDCQPIVSKLPNPEREQLPSSAHPATPELESKEEADTLSLGEAVPLDQLVFASAPSTSDDTFGDSLAQATDAEYVDATLTLVYNPETGEIESVETTVDDSSSGGGSEELKRKTFGGGQEKKEGETREKTDEEKPISVDRLEDMVRVMTESLAEAMKNSDRRPNSEGERQQDDSPSTPPNSPSIGQKPFDVMSLLKELKDVWGVDATGTRSMSPEELDKITKVQEKLREQRKRQVLEQPKNEAFEQMRKGFERKYEPEEEEEGSAHPRDEL